MSAERRWNSNSFSFTDGYHSSATSSEEYLNYSLIHEKPRYQRRSRPFFIGIGVLLLALSTVGALYSRPTVKRVNEEQDGPETGPLATSNAIIPFIEPPKPVAQDEPEPTERPYDSAHFLKGPPAKRFRDNLRPDMKYISSWISAGWTNDVMTYINLIYLGIITDRIPVIAMFSPTHVGNSVPPIPFGEVFDVPRLRKSLQRPVIEWREVKDPNSEEIEDLGCWNVWEATQYNDHFPRRSVVPGQLGLDISYTKAPSWIKLIPNFEHDQHTTFWSLAVLAFPEGRRDNLVPPLESPQHHALLPPDEQLLCYDYLYYLCAQQPFEFNFDYSPAWRFVGQYMRWTPRLDALVDQYVRRTIGVPDGDSTPNWISIHIRHGDFKNWCGDVPIADCFAPLSVIATRVQEVKEELLARMGIVVENVIMTSDERGEEWWKAVRSRGWFQVDHSQTVQLYGSWYPVLIDAAIQSNGMGFVGTDRSTMSILARRRVQSWHNGAARMVKWGKPGADDH